MLMYLKKVVGGAKYNVTVDWLLEQAGAAQLRAVTSGGVSCAEPKKYYYIEIKQYL